MSTQKLEFSQQTFEKNIYQLSTRSLQWEASCSMRIDGRTEIHDEANCRFAPLYEIACVVSVQKPSTHIYIIACIVLWVVSSYPVTQYTLLPFVHSPKIQCVVHCKQ